MLRASGLRRLTPYRASRGQVVGAWFSLILVLVVDLGICHLVVSDLIVGGQPGVMAPFLWVDVSLVVPIAATVLISTGFWRRYVFWKPVPTESVWSLALSAVVAWLVLTGVFVVLGMLLFYFDVFHRRSIEKSALLYALWENLGWHFLDSIPALKVPKTIQWEHPSPRLTGTPIGVFFLVYKVLVILPVLSVVALVVSRREAHDGQAEEEGSDS